jgi:hypothetical protein
VRLPWASRSEGDCTVIVVPYGGGFTTT